MPATYAAAHKITARPSTSASRPAFIASPQEPGKKAAGGAPPALARPYRSTRPRVYVSFRNTRTSLEIAARLPREPAHGDRDADRRPRREHEQRGQMIPEALALDPRARQPVDEVLERQRLGDVADELGRVLLVIEHAGDQDLGEEDGVHVRGRGLRVRDRVRERDAQRREADD